MESGSSGYPVDVHQLARAVLEGSGETPVALRRAVEARAARLAAGDRPDLPLPAELDGFVRQVALRATEVTDGDIARLRAAGYSEDAIFEVTVAAALGAGLARLERGLAALGKA
jgi:alkylhydroperoxidase family enzyme